MNKKQVYNARGIEFKNGKIYAPLFGWINPLLVNGNSKLGNGVWTWSMLPGTNNYIVNIEAGDVMEIKGTCNCDCNGCYAKTGFYNMPSVQRSNAIKTALARLYPEFVKNAIVAQIQAENIKLVRIHAAGDFFNNEYIEVWKEIAKNCNDCIFWTYTKNTSAENAFTKISNVNVVKSCIPGKGFNFGHCNYIIDTYNELKQAGKNVYICRCGIDNNQHCNNCKGCSKNEYVLFVEHSTSYKAIDDPHFSELAKIIDGQSKQ